MKRIILSLVLLLLFVFNTSGLSGAGQLKSDKLSAEEKEKNKFDTANIEETIKNLSVQLKKESEKKTKISAMKLLSYGSKITQYSKWSLIEKEMKIRRSWFEDIGKICSAMGSIKNKFYTAKVNKDIELINKCVTYYRALRVKCLKLLEKPPRIKTQSSGRHTRR